MNRTEFQNRLDLSVKQWFREMSAADVPLRVFEGVYKVTVTDGEVAVERDKEAEAAADATDKEAIDGKHYGLASVAALRQAVADRKLDIADAGKAASQDDLIAALMTDDRAAKTPPSKADKKSAESAKTTPDTTPNVPPSDNPPAPTEPPVESK